MERSLGGDRYLCLFLLTSNFQMSSLPVLPLKKFHENHWQCIPPSRRRVQCGVERWLVLCLLLPKVEEPPTHRRRHHGTPESRLGSRQRNMMKVKSKKRRVNSCRCPEKNQVSLISVVS